jgi:hypothetical protein
MLRKIFITMLIVSAICFSGLSAFACNAELSANCTGFTFTGAGTHDWETAGITRFCVYYSVTLTNEAGTIIIPKSGSKEYSSVGLKNMEKLNFTIPDPSDPWGTIPCDKNYEVTGNIKFYFGSNCDNKLENDPWWYWYWEPLNSIKFDCCATAITLASFDAKPGNLSVKLVWVTGDETDNLGFNIYRAESKEGEYVKINGSLIASKVGSGLGTSYEFTDSDVKNRKAYDYKLEDVDINGVKTMHGPVKAVPRLIYGIGK